MSDLLSGKRSPFRYYHPYLLPFTILGISLPALLFLLIMALLGWQIPVVGIAQGMPFVSSASKAVYVYVSPSSRSYFTSIGANYDRMVSPWISYMKERRRPYQVVDVISQLEKLKDGVLILPSALALSTQERQSLMAFRNRGGSLIVSWSTGTRDEQGQWMGWQFLEALGGQVKGELQHDDNPLYLIAQGQVPVSYHLPAGQRTQLAQRAEKPLLLNAELVAARYSYATLIKNSDPGSANGAVVFSESERNFSRSVIIGFAETYWEASPFDLYRLIDGAIDWAKRDVAVVSSNWPAPYLSAYSLSMEVGPQVDSALTFANQLRSVGLPATFFVSSNDAQRSAQLVNQLARDFEIGYRGDSQLGFSGFPQAQQEQRLAAMREDMRRVLNTNITLAGFCAPGDSIDSTTEMLLHKNGIRYHAANRERVSSQLPEMAKVRDSSVASDLVILPKTHPAGSEPRQSNTHADAWISFMEREFHDTMRLGGLGFFSVHSKSFSQVQAWASQVPKYLKTLQQQGHTVWVATPGEVADWWRDRQRLNTSASYKGRRVEFNLTVTGDKPLRGASLIVMLPNRGAQPVIKATKINTVELKAESLDGLRARVVLPELTPGNYAYQITF